MRQPLATRDLGNPLTLRNMQTIRFVLLFSLVASSLGVQYIDADLVDDLDAHRQRPQEAYLGLSLKTARGQPAPFRPAPSSSSSFPLDSSFPAASSAYASFLAYEDAAMDRSHGYSFAADLELNAKDEFGVPSPPSHSFAAQRTFLEASSFLETSSAPVDSAPLREETPTDPHYYSSSPSSFNSFSSSPSVNPYRFASVDPYFSAPQNSYYPRSRGAYSSPYDYSSQFAPYAPSASAYAAGYPPYFSSSYGHSAYPYGYSSPYGPPYGSSPSSSIYNRPPWHRPPPPRPTWLPPPPDRKRVV